MDRVDTDDDRGIDKQSDQQSNDNLMMLQVIITVVLTIAIVVFALGSTIPIWTSKKEKWSRDFQYLIHGVLIFKVAMLLANMVDSILKILMGEQHDMVDFSKAVVFSYDCSIMMAMWYVVLFCKSVKSSSFVGPKRVPYHIMAIFTSISIAAVDIILNDCQ